MSLVSLLLLVPALVIGSNADLDRAQGVCNKKYFNQNSFVCVCSLKSCPSIEPVSQVPEGFVDSWESSKARYRFHHTTFRADSFSKNPFNFIWTLSPFTLKVDLDPSDRRQVINGFGGSFTDAAGYNLASLPPSLADRILKDYFSKEGLDYAAGRVPIGGTDFSNRVYTLDDDHPDDFDLEFFSLQPEDFDFKIPVIKRAYEYKNGSPLKIIGSVWSPPAWMKTNNRIDGSGLLKGSPGGPYYKTMAKYYVRFLEEYAKQGIDIWALTTGNEPTNAIINEDFFFNSLGYEPERLRDFIKLDMGPILEESGWGTERLQLIMHDEVKDFLPNYTEVVLSDPEAAQYITGIGWHWYKKDPSNAHYDYVEQVHARFPEYFLMSTEACEGFERFSTERAQLGNWTRAETYVRDMIQGLNRYSTGWLDWNLVLDLGGGPSWAENWTDGLILVDASKATYYRNPMFYAMGQLSKFIPPGSVCIGHKVSGDSDRVFLAAFIDPDDRTVVVISNENDRSVDIILNQFADSQVLITMEAHSIRTLLARRAK